MQEGHRAYDCTNPHHCKRCNKQHHTLLHHDRREQMSKAAEVGADSTRSEEANYSPTEPKQGSYCSFNPALVPWGLFDPSPPLLTFFSETVTNTDITFYVFYPKTFLTMSHTFANFCVFPFIFYLCLFSLGVKLTPMVPPA